MKAFTIKAILLIAIIFVLLTALDRYYTKYTISHKNLCEKSDWILNHKDEKFDFAFIGNSRVINMVDINAIEKLTNKSGINLGLIGANYSENYLVLDQFLKAGNTIKNLIIQMDMHNLNSSKELGYPFHNYNYMHLLSDTTVFNVVKDNNPGYKAFIWKYIPFSRYMEFSNKYVFYKILKGGYECKTSDDFDATKGSTLINGPFDPKKHVSKYTYWTIKENDEKYLFKLIELAKAKNIQVVFYSAPIYCNYLNYQLRYKEVFNEIKNKIIHKNIKVFDFNQGTNLIGKDITNFNDNIHLNSIGVQKFSISLIDSIVPLLK